MGGDPGTDDTKTLSGIHPKVIASTSAAVVADAAVTILDWGLEQTIHLVTPILVFGAEVTLATALFAFLGGYLAKNAP
jgi:hypothetical protein